MDYVAYYRVSTQMQGKSGLGLEAQKVTVNGYVQGSPVIGEFTEVESGKSHIDRPQLKAALAMAKANNATLLIAKLDRLSRNLHFITGLLEENVPMVACDMPNANKFQWHIMGAVAEQERDLISERTKAAIAAKRTRGDAWGTNQRRSTAADQYAAQLAATIANIQADGAVMPAQIARELNGRGLLTINGTQWGSGQVVRLLRRING